MKRSSFERAKEIDFRLEYLEELIGLLTNAASEHHKLAATRGPDSYVREISIVNEIRLTIDLRDTFIEVIRAEQKELRDEFDNL